MDISVRVAGRIVVTNTQKSHVISHLKDFWYLVSSLGFPQGNWCMMEDFTSRRKLCASPHGRSCI